MATLPPNTESNVLSRRALIGLNRIGDVMLPRHGKYPSFSELGCIQHVDLVVANAPKDDVASLNTLLAILSVTPRFALRMLVWMTQHPDKFGPLASLLRLLDLGMRSVIVSLYYSGKHGANYSGPTPIDLMEYRLNIIKPEGAVC